ncbi:polyprenol monophosphomannose synthase [candidate division KSB1 bacterium]|nr:MAG: polyprenol monophosphomannose synthase [candidate division KSB1 bacterium]
MKTLIIIPTYNERENIERIIDCIFSVDNNLNVLVVDDNSPDKTWEIVEKMVQKDSRVFLIRRKNKLGLGTAYIEGFKFALKNNYDYIFEMDADFSHDPKEIPNFLKTVKDYDLVIGSRYIRGVNVVNWPLRRLILSYGANVYTRIITGLPIKDSTGGFKCFRRKVLESLALDKINSGGYSFQIEVNYKVWKKGFRIKEIPIVFVDRTEGKSKMSKKIIREAIWMVWKLRFLSLFGKLD